MILPTYKTYFIHIVMHSILITELNLLIFLCQNGEYVFTVHFIVVQTGP